MSKYEKQNSFEKYKNKNGKYINIGDIVQGDDRKTFRIKEIVYGNSRITYPIKAVEVCKDNAGNFKAILSPENKYKNVFLKPAWITTVSHQNSFLEQQKKKSCPTRGSQPSISSSQITETTKALVSEIFKCKKKYNDSQDVCVPLLDCIREDKDFNNKLDSLIKLFI